MRRGEMTPEFGRASFDKEFRAANSTFNRGLDDPICPSPLIVLSKTIYQVWEMQMQVHLEAYSLCEAI